MLDAIFRICNNTKKLNSEEILKRIFLRTDVKALAVKLQREQMFEDGVDSKGRSLGNYSEASVKVYGKRPGHIQVYDTGEFQEGIKIKNEGEILINANTIKTAWDGAIDLLDRWPDLLGLNEKSLSEIREFIKPLFIEEVRKSILA